MSVLRVALLVAAYTSASECKAEDPEIAFLDKWVAKGRELTNGRVGDVGIGAGTGFVCGFLGKKVQGMVVNTAIVGGALAAGACYFGFTNLEQLKNAAQMGGTVLENKVKQTAEPVIKSMDRDGDGDLDLDDSKVLFSKITARHGGLAAGFAGGLVVGYNLG